VRVFFSAFVGPALLGQGNAFPLASPDELVPDSWTGLVGF
jgi:hypothetical protein